MIHIQILSYIKFAQNFLNMLNKYIKETLNASISKLISYKVKIYVFETCFLSFRTTMALIKSSSISTSVRGFVRSIVWSFVLSVFEIWNQFFSLHNLHLRKKGASIGCLVVAFCFFFSRFSFLFERPLIGFAENFSPRHRFIQLALCFSI